MPPTDRPSEGQSVPAFPEFAALIAGLMAMNALSIDIMLPALPRIPDGYGLAPRYRERGGPRPASARPGDALLD